MMKLNGAWKNLKRSETLHGQRMSVKKTWGLTKCLIAFKRTVNLASCRGKKIKEMFNRSRKGVLCSIKKKRNRKRRQ